MTYSMFWSITYNLNMCYKLSPAALKYISLLALTLHDSILGLSMRYARTHSNGIFLTSTFVLTMEVVKIISSLAFLFFEEDKSFKKLLHALQRDPIDTLKYIIPASVHIVQNNLLYLAVSHLDVVTYQVTYQLKILTTALFAVVMLKRKILFTQWIALVMLVVGVVLTQLGQYESDVLADSVKKNAPKQNQIIGLLAALSACFLSGFAGIYLEKLVKFNFISLWMRAVRLSVLGIPFGIFTCFLDASEISDNGFFYGYDLFVWYLILLNAFGGFIIALVVFYGDNILKGFATSVSIILTCIASIYIFDFHLAQRFSLGAGLVIISTFLYGFAPKIHAPAVTSVHKLENAFIYICFILKLK